MKVADINTDEYKMYNLLSNKINWRRKHNMPVKHLVKMHSELKLTYKEVE